MTIVRYYFSRFFKCCLVLAPLVKLRSHQEKLSELPLRFEDHRFFDKEFQGNLNWQLKAGIFVRLFPLSFFLLSIYSLAEY